MEQPPTDLVATDLVAIDLVAAGELVADEVVVLVPPLAAAASRRRLEPGAACRRPTGTARSRYVAISQSISRPSIAHDLGYA